MTGLVKDETLPETSSVHWSDLMKTSVFYFDDEQVLLDIFQEMFGDEYKIQTASTLS